MAIEAYKVLAQGQASASAAALYTCGTTAALIKSIHLVNTSNVDCWIKLWLKGSADGNVILPPVTMGAGEFAIWAGTITLENGDTFQVQAQNPTSITVTIDGGELT